MNMSKRFNSAEKREHVAQLYKFDTDAERELFKKTLQGISVCLRVLNSWRKEIKVEEFGEYLKQTHLALHQQFPWMDDNSVFSC